MQRDSARHLREKLDDLEWTKTLGKRAIPGVFVFAAFSSHWQLLVGLYETLFCQRDGMKKHPSVSCGYARNKHRTDGCLAGILPQ
jgi:hypothetical protein